MLLARTALRGARARPAARALSMFVELERDVVTPKWLNAYQRAVAEHAPARQALDSNYLGSFGVAVGRTSSVYHLSRFADYDARDAREATPDLRVGGAGAGGLTQTETSVFAEVRSPRRASSDVRRASRTYR